MSDERLAFFITWTVYGTFLQGDPRGWRKWKHGMQAPQPWLVPWHAARLKYPVLLLDDSRRQLVNAEILRFCEWRGWKLRAHDARTNHVHVVVQALGYSGSQVRDQLKANCTRVLREHSVIFHDRPVWTERGDWQCLNDVDDLEQAILYVSVAQDRKGRELPHPPSAGGR
ncbi:MAG: hypothetical protein JWN70_2913 [Planctomycetaceae bacterium]|nr:hypothetical protein [Planctomycetaceae bacterium]